MEQLNMGPINKTKGAVLIAIATALMIAALISILYLGTAAGVISTIVLYLYALTIIAVFYTAAKKLPSNLQQTEVSSKEPEIRSLINELSRVTAEIRAGNLFARGDVNLMEGEELKDALTEANKLTEILFNYFDNVPCCITVFDAELRVVFFNKMTRAQGYDGEAIYGQYLLDALPPEEAKVWFKHVDHVKKTGEDCDYKLTMIAPTGETLVESHSVTSVRDSNDKMLVAFVACVDISAIVQIGSYQELETSKITKELQEGVYKGNLHFTYELEPFGENTATIAAAYKLIGNTLESSVTFIKGYVDEISQILHEFSNNNFDVEIKQNYIGDFGTIKHSIERLMDSVGSLISEIKSASDQVDKGAAFFAESINGFMISFNEQAQTINDMRQTISRLSEKTDRNASETKNASLLSNEVREAANTGNRHMQGMSTAMADIKNSASEILGIVKVIEGIAFQTNLLALNASVEAARAGEHGKGFAVVADEVRNLANRSAVAAKETANLLDESISRVNTGSEISVQTAESLQNISTIAQDMVKVVATISQASSDQAEDINQINKDMEDIYNSTTENNSVLQNNAAISQELSSNSQQLNALVARFRVKL